MSDYRIKIGGIADGIHSFTFEIKDSFFKAFSQSEVKHATIIATVLLEKQSDKLALSIQLNGEVNHLLCDICAEDISVEIAFATKMIVKETSEDLESTDEIIYINSNDNELRSRSAYCSPFIRTNSRPVSFPRPSISKSSTRILCIA